LGYIRWDVPVGHEKFGKVEVCVCRSDELVDNARDRLYTLSSLDLLSHLTFDNFSTRGNPRAEFVTPQEMDTLQEAREAAETFAANLTGWLLLEGGYGSGKTHLAAAIGNAAAERGVLTLFITVPDLLDSLRFAYSDPQTTFEARFEEIRGADLLVMDDFGTQNATGWAQEKLFQIINHRYINKLPTVITTNLILDEIEARIRSRLQDADFVRHVKITAGDYRRPNATSNPGISMLSLPDIKAMTLGNFSTRDDEVGQEIVMTVVKERQDNFGRPYRDKEITREKVTPQHVKRLHEALDAAARFAEQPSGWLVFLGPSHVGKTHLAAAIGNYRLKSGGQVILTGVTDLLDYLKTTFRPNSDVSFDRRFYEIQTTPLLMLDDLKESGNSSTWAEDKLHQILNHRYYAGLSTVITSTLDPDSFAKSYPSLWNKLLDTGKARVYVMDMPPYRRPARAGRRVSAAKKSASR
jgi:DNA replication protein DnaC